MTTQEFQNAILRWFCVSGRDNLPWQKNISAYSVWISEIMLQQTRVNTVIPYFERFMRRFPGVRELSNASIDEVLHYWTGLGYYARARNLHRTALIVANQLGGCFPSDIDTLITLPGIGRSTAGAIRSIAFKKPGAILDGNVKRVLSRFAAIEGWPGHTRPLKNLWSISEELTPLRNTDSFSQAMMDLGATVCISQPKCHLCPITSGCKAYLSGTQQKYPGKKPKTSLPVKKTHFLMIYNKKLGYLLRKNKSQGIWGGLWAFPQISKIQELDLELRELGLKSIKSRTLATSRHTFSHYHLDYVPVLIHAKELKGQTTRTTCGERWYNPKTPVLLGMPAPVVSLLEQLNN
jgi:A/G-specific adenine glycosylase